MHVVGSRQQPAHGVQPVSQVSFWQMSPAVHAPLVPQVHVPSVHAFAVVELHAVHEPPAVPQVAMVAGRQVLPSQQPSGHDAAVQLQTPPTHSWWSAHGGLAPQWQVPPVQVSDWMPQSTQALPALPQVAAPAVSHCPPAQQPVGHETLSQTHRVPRQRWPATHAAPPPQAQAPPMQSSARFGSQGAHAAPVVPQASNVGVVQWVPAQQPLGQLRSDYMAEVSRPLPNRLLMWMPLPAATPVRPQPSGAMSRSV